MLGLQGFGWSSDGATVAEIGKSRPIIGEEEP